LGLWFSDSQGSPKQQLMAHDKMLGEFVAGRFGMPIRSGLDRLAVVAEAEIGRYSRAQAPKTIRVGLERVGPRCGVTDLQD